MQVHGRQMHDELRALVAQALVGAPEKVRRAHAVASREESAL
jgi:plasmid stability protein